MGGFVVLDELQIERLIRAAGYDSAVAVLGSMCVDRLEGNSLQNTKWLGVPRDTRWWPAEERKRVGVCIPRSSAGHHAAPY